MAGGPPGDPRLAAKRRRLERASDSRRSPAASRQPADASRESPAVIPTAGPAAVQPSASSLTMASDRLSPPPWARVRALPISISLASRGDSVCTMAPSSRGLK